MHQRATILASTLLSMLLMQGNMRFSAFADEGHAKKMKSTSITDKGVTLSVECGETLVSGAANYMTITIRNDRESPIYFFPVSPQGLGFGLLITKNNEPAEMTSLGKAHLIPASDPRFSRPIHIKKGQQVRIVANISRYYDLSIPGSYQVVVSWSGWLTHKDGIVLKTKPLDVKIVEDSQETDGPIVTETPKSGK